MAAGVELVVLQEAVAVDSVERQAAVEADSVAAHQAADEVAAVPAVEGADSVSVRQRISPGQFTPAGNNGRGLCVKMSPGTTDVCT